jgi:signal transduction histidine kinase
MTSSSKAIAACALLILVCIGTLSYWSEVRNDQDREWVTHTLHVVEKLQTLRIDITQCETGQRGYMLTGQDRYLELYEAGVAEVRQDLKELPDLTADNPREQRAIRQLNPLIASRLAELNDGIWVRKESGLLAGVEAATRANNGEKWMGQIAAQIGEMRDTEAGLLSSRYFVIQREIGKRNLAERSLKRSNERLERRTAELSETNIELESFAYSVAHDLRAPLRHIAGYSGVMVQDYGPHLDAEGLRCLEKITGSAKQMGRLVDDLLGLSQIGRQELSFQDTPLGSLVGQVVEDLAAEHAGRSVEWQIGELFSAECDPGLMKQVFVNLLSNAVKYTRKREHAVIQVGQTRQNGVRVVFVRDNGVGFEMQYVGKLFRVFQRLHKARDFEGTGVGLATVQRIIRRHGGRIWAEAELDRGATFFFTLGSPENKPNEQAEVPMNEKDERERRKKKMNEKEEELHVERS